MKKIIALFFIFITLFLFVSCDGSTTNYNSSSNRVENKNEKDLKSNYYTVEFITNGGTYIPSQEIKVGKYLKSVPETTKDGYLFEGWYFDPTFTQGATFPIQMDKDITIYAKWLKLQASQTFKDSEIDNKLLHISNVSYSLTPEGFNMDRLAELGYRIRITVSYEVYYRKDYNSPFDIGYFGAPEFETYIKNETTTVAEHEKQTAKKQAVQKEISYSAKIAEVKDRKITLTFSTDNVQNIIYFENITAVYECYK